MYMRSEREWAKHLDFMLWDVVCLQIAFALGFTLRLGPGLLYLQPEYRALAILYAFLDLLVAVVFNTMHDVLKRGTYDEIIQSAKQAILVLLFMALYMFVVQKGVFYSRLMIFYTAIFHFLIGFVVRRAWRSFLLAIGVGRSRSTMFLVAHERDLRAILSNAKKAGNIEFSGLVLTNRDAKGKRIAGIPVVANLSDVADYLRREWVDEVLICSQRVRVPIPPDKNAADQSKKRYVNLVDLCCEMAIPVHVRLAFTNVSGKSFTEKIAGYNVLTMAANYASGLQIAIKRITDIVGGIVGSIIAILIIIIVGPIIKYKSPGPILFKQTRVGLNGKQFQMYKIRSMYMDAEEHKKDLMKQNRVSSGRMFKLDWDPRIIGNEILSDGTRKTGIGDFIRRTSLDEFPQFFNVLMGQMSLVGTRPPTVDEWESYEYHHRARLATKPGITGLWQVSGRSKITDFEEVVRLDMEYIQNWSPALDAKILLKTVRVVLFGDGAM